MLLAADGSQGLAFWWLERVLTRRRVRRGE